MIVEISMMVLAVLLILGQLALLLALYRLVRTFGQYAHHAMEIHRNSVAILDVIHKEHKTTQTCKEVA